MNLVLLTGRLSKEAKLKYIAGSGIPIAEFDIAITNIYSKDKENNKEFITIYCFKNLAETVVNNLEKGRLINVIGRLKSDIWKDDNNKTKKVQKVIADRIEFLDYPKNYTEDGLGFIPCDMSLVEGEIPF